MKISKIPEPTVIRLSVYSRFLNQATKNGLDIISSDELGVLVGIPPAQVRKDLSYFGEFGIRGVGYKVPALCDQVDKLLGTHQVCPCIVVGAGRLGNYIAQYPLLRDRGFHTLALFDIDPAKWQAYADRENGHSHPLPPVYPLGDLAQFTAEHPISIGVIAVPADQAQAVLEQLLQCQITHIINVAPVILHAPPHAEVRNIDIGQSLGILSFSLGFNTL
ncbi:redox-sensing transcriptional repressor Rex [Heliophilum fasciatum]|uniref:Redox-sensing transcriptional repressor Rex n=1 Tax=Heliophilum fasciatum TaxID=35700 RepID=A0A4R2RBS2_9FIRM|nr:redox-sensing transcriptional repressor Rex [Heliophilum fasciatum]MCW2279214.1 redox-sensing transcriptional repressor [Heliophilum fasciatum]TCP60802.1 redox-sensing transcriptional repressor [Heliophilum fasciatum]